MGPLKGLKVIEMVGLAPAPFLGLILSDFGAKVIRVDTLEGTVGAMFSQQKQQIHLNLKNPKGTEIMHRMTSQSDVLIDPFRPGVMERLNLGPDKLCELNPRLVYTRLSGFGQYGPIAQKASHDINFIALSGVMSRLGYHDRPPISSMNLMGDIGGGSILCALGVMMALYERNTSNLGQVIDHSMTEGTGYLGSFLWESLKQKDILWPNWPKRGANVLDFGAPFYRCYECSDGKFMAVGALEEKFWSSFINTIGIDEDKYSRYQCDEWPAMIEEISGIMKTKTRDEWAAIFDQQADACTTPVLDMDEVANYEHNRVRNSFEPENCYPMPAPKLSRTPAIGQRKGFLKQDDDDDDGDDKSQAPEILKEFGFSEQEINELGPKVVR